MALHLVQKLLFVIIGRKFRQLVREDVVRRGHQHHPRVPLPDQLIQQRDFLGLLHGRVVPGQMPLYQIAVGAQIDPADLLFLQRQVHVGLDRHPFVPADELIRQVGLILLRIVLPQKCLQGKFRPGGQHPVLRLRKKAVLLYQIRRGEHHDDRRDDDYGKKSASLLIHVQSFLFDSFGQSLPDPKSENRGKGCRTRPRSPRCSAEAGPPG